MYTNATYVAVGNDILFHFLKATVTLRTNDDKKTAWVSGSSESGLVSGIDKQVYRNLFAVISELCISNLRETFLSIPTFFVKVSELWVY